MATTTRRQYNKPYDDAVKWFKAMDKWGKKVQRDIKNLETHMKKVDRKLYGSRARFVAGEPKP